MHALEALDEFVRLLKGSDAQFARSENGVYLGDGHLARRAWCAFKELAALRADESLMLYGQRCTVDADVDMLLFETNVAQPQASGSQDAHRPDVYRVRCQRQFTLHDEDDEYVEMYQFILAFEAPLSPSLVALTPQQQWGKAGISSSEWIATVETSTPFRLVIEDGTASRIWFVQSSI